MNIYHKITKINNKDIILLYVEYPDEYEFSLDFDAFKKNIINVSKEIKKYISKNLASISDDTALLILNGIVVGTLLLTNLKVPKNTTPQPEIEVVETSSLNTTDTQKKIML